MKKFNRQMSPLFFFLFLFLFLINLGKADSFSFTTPSTKFDLTEEERYWMTKLFRRFMLFEHGIYTLAGSKPITSWIITYPEKRTRELTKKERDGLAYFVLNKENEEDIKFYESLSAKEKTKALGLADKDFIYSEGELWDKWESMQDRFLLSSRFLLVKKDITLSNSTRTFEIFFVDIFKTALVIQDNYDLFKKHLGFDFDPFQVVFELEKERSSFWDKISGSKGHTRSEYSILWGILFGFGRENSCAHKWWSEVKFQGKGSEKERLLVKTLPTWAAARNRIHLGDWKAFTISKFDTPYFVSFSENDPVVEKYEKERNAIQKMYKGKDFLDFTLELLTENSFTSKKTNIPSKQVHCCTVGTGEVAKGE